MGLFDGNIALPMLVFYAVIGWASIMSFWALGSWMSIRQNSFLSAIMKAGKGDKRLALVHYPNGVIVPSIPELIKPIIPDGQTSPYWIIDGTYRFRDTSGEKWEQIGNVRVLNYTARGTVPVSPDQAASMDQLLDILAKFGFSARGLLQETFYMITEASKGPHPEAEAWKKLRIQNREARERIKEVVDFVKANPDIHFFLIKSGAFTFKTAVTVLDQSIANGVTYLSHTISFVEDRTRRKLADKFENMMRWVFIIVPIIFAMAIGGVIFLLGSGIVGGK